MRKLNLDIVRVTGIVLLCTAFMPPSVMSGDFDFSKTLNCTFDNLIECIPTGECVKVKPAEVNLPDTIFIDYAKKTIATKEGGIKRTSLIENRKYIDGKLIVQGAEDGREDQQDGLGWTISVNDSTGKMTATGSGDEVAFVLFGSCTPE